MTDLRTARNYVRERIDAGDTADVIILDLCHRYGARFSETHRRFELRLAGITEWCEAGPISLLRAWLARANAELRAAA